MTAGLAPLIACDALGAAGAVIACRRTLRDRGRGAAAAEATILGLSLAAYTAACVWLGYGFAAQLAGLVASLIPLALGWRLVPALAEFFTGDRDGT